MLCTGSGSCNYANINWIQGAKNSLSCDYNTCSRTPYPQSLNDNTSYTVNCNEEDECRGTIIECPKYVPCYINCIGYESCRSSIIYCPISELCNVECRGSDACRFAIVHWSSNHSLANFTCPDGGDQCNLIRAPQLINMDTNNIWNNRTQTFECTKEKQCTSSVIDCPSQGTCIINCTSQLSVQGVCAASTINCPTDGDCIVICNRDYACRGAILNGPRNHEFGIKCTD